MFIWSYAMKHGKKTIAGALKRLKKSKPDMHGYPQPPSAKELFL
jgi:hypothetical protein